MCTKKNMGTELNLNPRPGVGLSHLRPGGGGQNDPPRLTRKRRGLGRRGKKQTKAHNKYVRKYFGHFFAKVNIEVARGHHRSNFSVFGVAGHIPL